MKSFGAMVLIIGVVVILAACEHDGDGSREVAMDIPTDTDTPRRKSSSPPIGEIPYHTLLEGTEFRNRFNAVIRSRDELSAFYLSHDVRVDGAAVRPAWGQVDFNSELVIYASGGRVVASKFTGYYVGSIESDGNSLIVEIVASGNPLCPPETFVTNYIGEVVVVEDFGLPIEFTRFEPLARCY